MSETNNQTVSSLIYNAIKRRFDRCAAIKSSLSAGLHVDSLPDFLSLCAAHTPQINLRKSFEKIYCHIVRTTTVWFYNFLICAMKRGVTFDLEPQLISLH